MDVEQEDTACDNHVLNGPKTTFYPFLCYGIFPWEFHITDHAKDNKK